MIQDMQIPLDKILQRMKERCADLTLTLAGIEVGFEQLQETNKELRGLLAEANEKLRFIQSDD
jgi:hypothetical protein